MNSNEQLIEEFYAAFANQNSKTMATCYHKEIQFQDPAFGTLKGKEVSNMWNMVIESCKGNLEIDFYNIKANENRGSATWIATYNFSKTNRKVINTIKSSFEFKDGLIHKHTDYFDLWKWSRQALGWKGLLLGWTGFMKNKIREQAKNSLKIYQEKS